MLDIDKLEKLAELKKNKLLTEEEFIEEKKKLFEINNTKVTNVFVWMLAFLPLFVSLFLTVTKTHLTEGELIAIYFLANSILCAIIYI